MTRGLDLDCQEAVGGVEDDIDLAARVGAEEMKGQGRRLRQRPAEPLVDDGGLEHRAVLRGRLLREEARERGMRD